MPDSQLIEYVGIVVSEVGHDKLFVQKAINDVRGDHAGLIHFVGSNHFVPEWNKCCGHYMLINLITSLSGR